MCAAALQKLQTDRECACGETCSRSLAAPQALAAGLSTRAACVTVKRPVDLLCRDMADQQAGQLQALSAQVVALKMEAASQQHVASELAAVRELCEAQAAELEAARQQLAEQVRAVRHSGCEP